MEKLFPVLAFLFLGINLCDGCSSNIDCPDILNVFTNKYYCCYDGQCCTFVSYWRAPLIGIVVGGLVLLGISIGLCCMCCCRRPNRTTVVTAPPMTVMQPGIITSHQVTPVPMQYPGQAAYVPPHGGYHKLRQELSGPPHYTR